MVWGGVDEIFLELGLGLRVEVRPGNYAGKGRGRKHTKTYAGVLGMQMPNPLWMDRTMGRGCGEALNDQREPCK